jgi:hypothetical protein
MLQNARTPPPSRCVSLIAILLAGVSGCALFDDYDYYGYDHVYDSAPTHAPVAGYGQAPYGAPHTPGRSSCGCSSGSAAIPTPPPPASAYQPTGSIVPVSASQSREPDLLQR